MTDLALALVAGRMGFSPCCSCPATPELSAWAEAHPTVGNLSVSSSPAAPHMLRRITSRLEMGVLIFATPSMGSMPVEELRTVDQSPNQVYGGRAPVRPAGLEIRSHDLQLILCG